MRLIRIVIEEKYVCIYTQIYIRDIVFLCFVVSTYVLIDGARVYNVYLVEKVE